ncbi:aminotransferase class V-fold PLP-dependent enzyme [Roseococcus sp. SYP-B2431]|uniref:cysteine desulfurase family protein n=1 Tax=Roseococcus sp. SYP-B2431 TaxID=2496640 RepID=UPI00103D1403|nr:aminotransferase class V-fold PLP-dependent enzyme [Roseococcus sp. SYP-B2431]TCI00841.1 aminotransferase class V-fold PLP-dependent enzyme [Roseococcus sp. SYP-B2431]
MTALDLDANATEALRPAAREALIAALELGGNPSSVHGGGRVARRVLEQARGRIAARFGAAPGDVVLTSGGTEANALAIHGLMPGRRALVGATEHAAVRAAAPEAMVIPVRPDGTVELDTLAKLLAEGPPALVCLMAANNETGVLHPLAEVAALCREHGALLHVDAVQSAGRIGLDSSGAASIAISAHKLGGVPGAGALILAPGLHLTPLIAGGGQERGRRGGTEPLPAIAAFGAAVAESYDAARIARLRDAIEAGLRRIAPEAVIAGAAAPRLPNTTLAILPGVPAETQVIALDLAGLRVSAGSACSSGKVAASHVLEAMGFGADAGCGIRISLPWNAPDDAPERFLAGYAAMHARLSSRRAAGAT